ncbi:hypothetical protein IG631_08508 [Alternaria alternata]|nr:hypothetical protein IG631_08508 [Alternaria alternata]
MKMHVGRMIAVKSCGGWEDFCRDVVRFQAKTAECSVLLMKEILRCYTVIHTPVQHPFSHKHPASGQSAGLLRNPQLGNPPLTAAL